MGHLFQFNVADLNFYAVVGAEMGGELLGEEDGAVLAAGTAEGDHEAAETALLVIGRAAVNERENIGEELVNVFLLVEVVDDRLVAAGELLESLFAAGVGEGAGVEDESAAVAGVV